MITPNILVITERLLVEVGMRMNRELLLPEQVNKTSVTVVEEGKAYMPVNSVLQLETTEVRVMKFYCNLHCTISINGCPVLKIVCRWLFSSSFERMKADHI